jgi:outer membrane immunogenic protein
VSAVRAADPIELPVGTEAAVPVVEDTGFDWNGFYAGLYGVGTSSPAGGFQYGGGLALGANLQLDMFVLGAEVAYHGLAGGGGPTSYGQVIGKAGVLATDDIVVYAAAGYGFDFGVPVEDDVLLGGGVELAVAQDVSVRAQYLHGFPITGGNPKEQLTVGANFHF